MIIDHCTLGPLLPSLPSLAEHKMKDSARIILNSAEKAGCRILLPTDAVVAKELNTNADICVVPINECPKASMILDIGPYTVEKIKEILQNSKTVIWNGPPGAFEVKPFDGATNELANFISMLSNEKKLVLTSVQGYILYISIISPSSLLRFIFFPDE